MRRPDTFGGEIPAADEPGALAGRPRPAVGPGARRLLFGSTDLGTDEPAETAAAPGRDAASVVAAGPGPVPAPWLLAPLFVFLFLSLKLRIDTTLLYLEGPGLFVLDLDHLRQVMDYPGRPARYLTLFLQELDSLPVVGALAAGGIVTLLGAWSWAVFARTAPKGGGFDRTLLGWVAVLLPSLLDSSATTCIDRWIWSASAPPCAGVPGRRSSPAR